MQGLEVGRQIVAQYGKGDAPERDQPDASGRKEARSDQHDDRIKIGERDIDVRDRIGDENEGRK